MTSSRKGNRPENIYFDGQMHIVWQDGVHSAYKYWDLRIACPCAACVNELTGERILKPNSVDSAIHPLSSEYVGSYALRIRWSDNHDTGLYTFKNLRNAFPYETPNEPQPPA